MAKRKHAHMATQRSSVAAPQADSPSQTAQVEAETGAPDGETAETGGGDQENASATPAGDVAVAEEGSATAVAAVAAEDLKPNSSHAALIVFGMSDKQLPQGSWFPAEELQLATKAAGLMELRVLPVDTDEHRNIARQLRAGQVYAADRMFAPIIRQDLYNRLLACVGVAAEMPTLPRPTTFDGVELGCLVLANDVDGDEGWWEAIVVATTDETVQLRWRYAPRDPAFIRPRSELGLMPLNGTH